MHTALTVCIPLDRGAGKPGKCGDRRVGNGMSQSLDPLVEATSTILTRCVKLRSRPNAEDAGLLGPSLVSKGFLCGLANEPVRYHASACHRRGGHGHQSRKIIQRAKNATEEAADERGPQGTPPLQAARTRSRRAHHSAPCPWRSERHHHVQQRNRKRNGAAACLELRRERLGEDAERIDEQGRQTKGQSGCRYPDDPPAAEQAMPPVFPASRRWSHGIEYHTGAPGRVGASGVDCGIRFQVVLPGPLRADVSS